MGVKDCIGRAKWLVFPGHHNGNFYLYIVELLTQTVIVFDPSDTFPNHETDIHITMVYLVEGLNKLFN